MQRSGSDTHTGAAVVRTTSDAQEASRLCGACAVVQPPEQASTRAVVESATMQHSRPAAGPQRHASMGARMLSAPLKRNALDA